VSSEAAAVSRPKRRRRRPPTPREWHSIIACVIYALLLGVEVWFWLADPAEPGTSRIVIRVIALGGMFALTWLVFARHWSVVLNYLRNGYHDD
jgi:RsiW-degrading membrane proteinase PrsW (M82 family)